MADLDPITVRGLESLGRNSPKLTGGQVNNSESDDEKNDEAGVDGENQAGKLVTELLTERRVLRDYSLKEEEKEEKAKKEESDSIYSHDSELTSSSSIINTLPRRPISRGRNC